MKPDDHFPGKNWKHGKWKPMHGPWQGRPGRIFFRFLFSFGFLAILGAAVISVPFVLFSDNLPGPPALHMALRMGVCFFGIIFAFVLVGGALRVFRGIASPLGDVMEAADSVAAGDLSARVPESRGSFRQLSKSFNHMAEKLEREDEQRRQFTADVAHELRNPLHIIQGNLEGVLDGVYAPDADHIRNTLDETRLLARLVEDLQTLTLAEAGQLHLKFEPVDLNELLSDVRTSFSAQAEMFEIEFLTEIDEKTSRQNIPGDHERLQQILGNLVSNALRFTPQGGRIRVGFSSTPGGVTIQVEDSGEGIPPEELPYIFDRFWKADQARTRRPGSGSGLGLAITRQMVRAHGGTIAVSSEIGQGTRFTIELPIAQQTI